MSENGSIVLMNNKQGKHKRNEIKEIMNGKTSQDRSAVLVALVEPESSRALDKNDLKDR